MIEIHAELQRLSGLMHDVGYVPCMKLVLHDVEEEEKVFHLYHHSRNSLLHLVSSTQFWYSSPNKKEAGRL
jgi:hypothetical protein